MRPPPDATHSTCSTSCAPTRPSPETRTTTWWCTSTANGSASTSSPRTPRSTTSLTVPTALCFPTAARRDNTVLGGPSGLLLAQFLAQPRARRGPAPTHGHFGHAGHLGDFLELQAAKEAVLDDLRALFVELDQFRQRHVERDELVRLFVIEDRGLAEFLGDVEVHAHRAAAAFLSRV